MQGDTSGFISALWYHSKSSLYIMFANDKRMSYANKPCIHTGAVVSLKPKY